MTEIKRAFYKSEIGTIEVKGTESQITSVLFSKKKQPVIKEASKVIDRYIHQLDEYFNGQRKEFSLDFVLEGTDFQKKVWWEIMKVPYGKTASYKDIARRIGNSGASRAVGNASKNNKIVFIVPCHRIIGSHNELTGYGGELWRKEWLLKHEKKFS
ncbi:MAG: methylated-DNA--[protein]-cysteine S-methyltransferase [Candidatus Aminicenantaceae bacterium]